MRPATLNASMLKSTRFSTSAVGTLGAEERGVQHLTSWRCELPAASAELGQQVLLPGWAALAIAAVVVVSPAPLPPRPPSPPRQAHRHDRQQGRAGKSVGGDGDELGQSRRGHEAPISASSSILLNGGIYILCPNRCGCPAYPVGPVIVGMRGRLHSRRHRKKQYRQSRPLLGHGAGGGAGATGGGCESQG